MLGSLLVSLVLYHLVPGTVRPINQLEPGSNHAKASTSLLDQLLELLKLLKLLEELLELALLGELSLDNVEELLLKEEGELSELKLLRVDPLLGELNVLWLLELELSLEGELSELKLLGVDSLLSELNVL